MIPVRRSLLTGLGSSSILIACRDVVCGCDLFGMGVYASSPIRRTSLACVIKPYGDSTGTAHDPEAAPFVTQWLRLMMLSTAPNEQIALVRLRGLNRARWFHEAGLPVVLGVDAPEFPDGVHSELAELVAAGLTPAEALVATSAAARTMGIDDIGRVEVGKVADLVLLDADPLVEIQNTRRIWEVIQGGHLVDRTELRSIAAEGR